MRFEYVRRWALLMSLLLYSISLIAVFAGIRTVRADSAAFDLAGPRLEMTVSRDGKTLPISDVPNFKPGDRLWIHPELPDDQSVRYLLVVAFLRGSTNPPPGDWFFKAETWTRQLREEGMVVTVPKGAQQALLFLAPDADGGLGTLRSAVRAKPGAFVRASQDLNQASLDRSRLDKYLSEVKETSDYDPKALQRRSVLLARTLNIKLDSQCFDKPTEQQAPCLTDDTDNLVLDDGHSQSMVAALTSGPSSDLIGALGSSPVAGGGFYSPYIGAIVDLARIMGSFHTAEYQYIPALALPERQQLNLRLNNPPSFHKPKSVLVVGLPAVEAAQLPPLRAVDADQVFCLQKSPLVLPVVGAPLVFSTDIAHDFNLHLQTKSGNTVDLPAAADPARGGFVVDTRALKPGVVDSEVTGTLQGYWGFETFAGPRFHLQGSRAATWTVPEADQTALIVGRADTFHLQSGCAVCVDAVSIKDAQGKNLKATWSLVKPDELEVHVPLQDETAGRLNLSVSQLEMATPDELPLRSYAEAAHLDRFTIHAGDPQGILIGTRLDEVNSFDLKGVHFVPAKLSRADRDDQLDLAAANAPPSASLKPEEKLMARVALKDGRVLQLPTTVAPARPKVSLISKSVQLGPLPSPIRLSDQDELPQNGQLSFFLKTEVPDRFPQDEKIEVATTDGSFDALLSVSAGNLILQDSQTVLAKLDPAKDLGPSAFGPLRFRPVSPDGGNGDWQPLATLVRVPSLKEVRCPDSPDEQCKLSGANLFLIDSVASDSQFTHTISVPIGFVDPALSVPRPNGTLLYVKLRDDPSAVNMLMLPVLPEGQ
jgi:hypothetical protein